MLLLNADSSRLASEEVLKITDVFAILESFGDDQGRHNFFASCCTVTVLHVDYDAGKIGNLGDQIPAANRADRANLLPT